MSHGLARFRDAGRARGRDDADARAAEARDGALERLTDLIERRECQLVVATAKLRLRARHLRQLALHGADEELARGHEPAARDESARVAGEHAREDFRDTAAERADEPDGFQRAGAHRGRIFLPCTRFISSSICRSSA
jgi:hypothetical protein